MKIDILLHLSYLYGMNTLCNIGQIQIFHIQIPHFSNFDFICFKFTCPEKKIEKK